MMLIIKRDGSQVPFNKTKIRQAVSKAMKNGSGIVLPDIARLIANDAERFFSKQEDVPSIHKVEKFVFDRLLHYGQDYTARAYEGYRAVQEYKRERESDPLVESVLGLVNHTNEEAMTENSNKDAVLVSTQRDLIAGEISKTIAKEVLLPPHIVQSHEDGIVHYHDLDYAINPLTNCELVNLKDMLQNGTVINGKMIRKPKSLRTAMTIATQIAAAISSSTYGGQTLSLAHIAPFVRVSKEKIIENKRKEYTDLGIIKLIKKRDFDRAVEVELKTEIKDAVQTFNYQINTLCTSNGCNGRLV